MRTPIKFFAFLLLLGHLSGSSLLTCGQSQPNKSNGLALVGAKIYPSPAAAPIADGVVLIKNGRIVVVGEKQQIKIPGDARIIDCTGLTLVAGFWNSHVHFTESKWQNAASLSAEQLNQQLRDTFTRYGFTSVFDLGSSIDNTRVIRNRIESGEISGPRIFTTGTGIVPEGGTPFYVKPLKFPEALGPRQATALVREKLKGDPDAIKIFTGPTPVQGGPPLIMRLELVRAITAEAHRHHKLVFTHPENDAGVSVAVDGGVDILAHTAPSGTNWDEARIARMKRAGVTLIPTLSLFTKLGRTLGIPTPGIEKLISAPLQQLRAYSNAGGRIVFGTDLGFIADYDPSEEYLLMTRAGMSFRQILTSLTTNPTERLGVSHRTGRIISGMDADIVIIAGDPEVDIRALSNVKYTLRKGHIIYPFTLAAYAQQPSRNTLYEILEKEGCVTNEQSKVTICKYDYLAEGKNIEAFTIRPLAEGKYPSLVLLAGREGAKTLFTFGTMLAQQGFASLALTEPGFGKSEGKGDFMGPKSIEAFAIGFKKFRKESFVDAEKMGVYGYSRGGMAASLLTVKLGRAVKAAVFGAGVYDFKKAYDETKFDAIRENIRTETRFTEKAIQERSSILQMKHLKTPVLIIHGENDENVPTNQALLLRDRLTELKKDFEIIILSDHKHGQLKGNFISPVIDFFSRKLKGVPANVK